METLSGKKILLGVTGGIAAYKTASLVRLLAVAGAEIRVIMTPEAKLFVTPLTLATLSKHPVYTQLFNDATGEWVNHVQLGQWADALVIAPAGANTLAKMVTGQCDNLLLVTYLSATCPVFVAPAMDADMWTHPATQSNIDTLISRQTHILGPASGELASGMVGLGRMDEPKTIVERLNQLFSKAQSLAGKRALVTAGPTYEAIDPVRFVGNRSSGKMGFALAEALASRGAHVTLVSGPTVCRAHHAHIELCHVTSAQEMFDACATIFEQCDMAIFAAAVADYKPVQEAAQKIKKEKTGEEMRLMATPDIAAELGRKKRRNQLTVGFALETDHEEEHARKKMAVKNLDLIAINSLQDLGAGFGGDTNKISLIDNKGGEIISFTLKSKREVAEDIVDVISKRYV